MNINIRLLLLLAFLTLLSSCARNPALDFSTALKHVGAQDSPVTKLDKGVYVMTIKIVDTREEFHLKSSLIRLAATETIQRGYRNFAILRDQKEDKELLEAVKKKKVRKLLLKRIRNKSQHVGRITTVKKIRVRTDDPSDRTLVRMDGFMIVVMFKDNRHGMSAHKVLDYLDNGTPLPGGYRIVTPVLPNQDYFSEFRRSGTIFHDTQANRSRENPQ